MMQNESTSENQKIAPEVMTLEEAAEFLRVSRSTLYQRADIPRHRMPGSREFRYLRSELLAWLKGEFTDRLEAEDRQGSRHDESAMLELAAATKPVYHRNPRYR